MHSCQCSSGRSCERLQLLPAVKAAPLQLSSNEALPAAHHAAMVYDGHSHMAPCLRKLQQDLHLAAHSAPHCLLNMATVTARQHTCVQMHV